MKKTIIYSSLVLLLAAAVACNKTDSPVSEEPIRFAFATDAATRALNTNATEVLRTQTIKVYDDMGATPYYIDDAAAYSGGTWNFVSGHAYTWRTGSHKFFAYTNEAGTFASGVLTVSKTLTTADADQVDILYSDIVTKTQADAGQAVTIPMSHLFAAAGIMVKNATDGNVTVNSVSATGIKNQGYATVDFTGATTAVTYGTVSGSLTGSTLSNVTLAANGMADVLGQAAADAAAYWLVWPQAIAAEGITVAIEYTIGAGTTAKKYTSEVKLPTAAVEWKAGYKYLYTINVNPHDIKLEFTVTDWVENEGQDIIVE
ncbi:MAG: fimbrillin family protein [Bacteroidales bacterium]|nr:fimbrillin family protein [Bacteroidales bacterium]